MERNWLIISTKQKQEQKVAEFLTKKGIQNFCPIVKVERKQGSKSILEDQPLFTSFVFVSVNETEMQTVRTAPFFVNLVYWLTKPVIIKQEEINAIKMMAENYLNIRLEKTKVCINENISLIEENITDFKNNVMSIAHKGLTVTIPSLGYKIIGNREKSNEIIIKKNTAFKTLLPKLMKPGFLFGF